MAYVIDTGVLLRAFEESDPHHQTVRQMLKTSRRAGWELITVPKNMAELWVVSTRPTDHNGYETGFHVDSKQSVSSTYSADLIRELG